MITTTQLKGKPVSEAFALAATESPSNYVLETNSLQVRNGAFVALAPKSATGEQQIPFTSRGGRELLRLLRLQPKQFKGRIDLDTFDRVVSQVLATEQKNNSPIRPLHERLRVFTRQGQPTSVLSAKVAAAPMQSFIDTIEDAANDAGVDLSQGIVQRGNLRNGTLELGVTWQEFACEPVANDVCFFGIWMRHSAIGQGATRIGWECHRLICANGLTQRYCLDDGGTPRVRRGNEQNFEKTMGQVRSMAADVFRKVPSRMAALKQLIDKRDRPLNLRAAVERLVEQHRFSKKVRNELLLGLTEGDHDGHENDWGLTNLLTHLTTHGPRETGAFPMSVQRTLSDLAGVVSAQPVHLCKHCRAILHPSRN